MIPSAVCKRIIKSDEEWEKQLTPEQFRVARMKGTEPPFSGVLCDSTKTERIYYCVCCHMPLFSSKHKFDSGSGWPSFFAPLMKENIALKADYSLLTQRTEVLCASCDAHLGHVFDDGPPPTGKRYCINAVVLSIHND